MLLFFRTDQESGSIYYGAVWTTESAPTYRMKSFMPFMLSDKQDETLDSRSTGLIIVLKNSYALEIL
jgi:hypothetical protein